MWSSRRRLRSKDPETIILFVAQQPDFQWIVSDPILEEYKEVLGRKRFALGILLAAEVAQG